jgi:hypothetical protein
MLLALSGPIKVDRVCTLKGALYGPIKQIVRNDRSQVKSWIICNQFNSAHHYQDYFFLIQYCITRTYVRYLHRDNTTFMHYIQIGQFGLEVLDQG